MSRAKYRGKYVAIIMSRIKMSHSNDIAQQICRAHNVAAYQSIDFLPTSKSCDIKQVRMLYPFYPFPQQFVYGHFVYDTSSTDISSTTLRLQTFRLSTVYQRVAQLYIQLLFQQIIIFINSNFYLHYDSFLSIPLPLTLLIIQHIQLASIVA